VHGDPSKATAMRSSGMWTSIKSEHLPCACAHRVKPLSPDRARSGPRRASARRATRAGARAPGGAPRRLDPRRAVQRSPLPDCSDARCRWAKRRAHLLETEVRPAEARRPGKIEVGLRRAATHGHDEPALARERRLNWHAVHQRGRARCESRRKQQHAAARRHQLKWGKLEQMQLK